jgi:pectate lyase
MGMAQMLLWLSLTVQLGCGQTPLSGVHVSAVTTSQATVEWSTRKPSDSRVGFAKSPSTTYMFTPCCQPTGTKAHVVSLDGLIPATNYNFVVQSFDGSSHLASEAAEFTTAVAPDDSNAAPKADTSVGAVHAFPEAQGGGAASVGGSGRSGGAPRIFEVTNLDDRGGSCNGDRCSGSLRFCLESSGPRTCVFRVSGLIEPQSRLAISNPYITIAGQTSPGGIVLGGPKQRGEVIFISTHDVIARYLTYDGNNPDTPTGPDTGTVGFEIASGNTFNIVLDHISARWWGNKAFPLLSNDAGNGHNVTYQWILAYEPDHRHPVGVNTDATSGSSLLTTDIDYHHNVFANIDHRIPFINAGRNIRWVNNLVFNWNQYAGLSNGGAHIDYIGNKYVDGNLSERQVHEFLANGNNNDPEDQSDNCIGKNPCDNPGPPSLFLLNNIGRHNAATTSVPNDPGQIAMTRQGYEGGEAGDPNSTGPMPSGWFRDTPLPAEAFPITQDSVSALENVLLGTVGNSRRLDCSGRWVSSRDTHDSRVINQYRVRGRGELFHNQFSLSPNPSSTLCPSSLHDGIPDEWKKARGLSLTDPTLWFKTVPNGYSYLENFLNGTNPAR